MFKKSRVFVKKSQTIALGRYTEIMKLRFEEEDLTERQACSVLTFNMGKTVL